MSKSNLSADAQCFVPSQDKKSQKLFLNNSYGESYNYYPTMNYTRHLYDVPLCSSYHTNHPYIVPVFNNFYSNESVQVTHFRSLQTHQQSDREHLETNRKTITTIFSDGDNVQHSGVLCNENDTDTRNITVENLCEGKVIISKSTKKRKAKKNKIVEEPEAIKTNVANKHLIDDVQKDTLKEDSKGRFKLTKSWSEVVAQGSNALKNDSIPNVTKEGFGAVTETKPSFVTKTSVKINQSMTPKYKTKDTELINAKASCSNDLMKSIISQNKNIRVLNRKEKLEHIEQGVKVKECKERKKEKRQSGKPGRSKSSDPLRLNKQQASKSTKFTDKPITLNIFEMISLSKKSKDGKLDGAHNSKSLKIQVTKKGPNLLDSSAVTKRGKEREIQKPKKPTKLRKVILKDRMLKRSKFLQSLGLLETRSLERLNIEYDLPLVVEDDITKIEFPSHKSALEHLQDVDPRVLSSIHSRRFREYCNQVVSKEINECCTTFLKELVRFQDNQFHRDPIKARIKRRLVFGLREVLKFLGVKKIKCVIISPNVEKIQSEGGLEEKIEKIITCCQVNSIPFVFALSRRQLGFTCFKKVPVSVVGILNYDGAEAHFKRLKELTEDAREKYQEMVSKLSEELTNLDLEDTNDLDILPTECPLNGKEVSEDEKID